MFPERNLGRPVIEMEEGFLVLELVVRKVNQVAKPELRLENIKIRLLFIQKIGITPPLDGPLNCQVFNPHPMIPHGSE